MNTLEIKVYDEIKITDIVISFVKQILSKIKTEVIRFIQRVAYIKVELFGFTIYSRPPNKIKLIKVLKSNLLDFSLMPLW